MWVFGVTRSKRGTGRCFTHISYTWVIAKISARKRAISAKWKYQATSNKSEWAVICFLFTGLWILQFMAFFLINIGTLTLRKIIDIISVRFNFLRRLRCWKFWASTLNYFNLDTKWLKSRHIREKACSFFLSALFLPFTPRVPLLSAQKQKSHRLGNKNESLIESNPLDPRLIPCGEKKKQWTDTAEREFLYTVDRRFHTG
jgi:hypothetical protein